MPFRKVFAAAAVVLVVASACGGGSDDCDGFVTINASPEECEARAVRLGCTTIERDGPSCGLFGCVRCTTDEDAGSEP